MIAFELIDRKMFAKMAMLPHWTCLSTVLLHVVLVACVNGQQLAAIDKSEPLPQSERTAEQRRLELYLRQHAETVDLGEANPDTDLQAAIDSVYSSQWLTDANSFALQELYKKFIIQNAIKQMQTLRGGNLKLFLSTEHRPHGIDDLAGDAGGFSKKLTVPNELDGDIESGGGGGIPHDLFAGAFTLKSLSVPFTTLTLSTAPTAVDEQKRGSDGSVQLPQQNSLVKYLTENNWMKRFAGNDWNKFRGAWGKREPNWNNLKGLWGKRVTWNKLSPAWGKRTV